MYISKSKIHLGNYLSSNVIVVNSFSKFLGCDIINNELIIYYLSPDHISDRKKSFDICIFDQYYKDFIDKNLKYIKSINIINDDFYKKYFLFLREVKSVEEIRDEKIDELCQENNKILN